MKTKKQRREAKRIKLRNKRLVKEFPFLRPRNVWTGKYDPDYDYSYTWLMDGGWFKLQVDLCREIKPLLEKSGLLNEYQLVQIKEKFGSLRWYDNGYPAKYAEEWHEIMSKYEQLAERTCILCGKPAHMCNIGSWFEPYCERCMERIHNNYNKQRKEPIPFKYEDYICD